MVFKMKEGSRAQVMNGTAEHTPGGLRKSDLKYNSQGRIVSKKKSIQAKKDQRLKKAGWTHKKGEFGAIKIEQKSPKKKGSKKKGSKKKGSKKR
tara:strand:+ start:1139 stop:1420 length:282 start_codon:yes stop_codon:yes gene_type:complete